MPAPYPQEYRDDVVRVARNRDPGVRLKDIAKDFGISESCLTNSMKAADVPGRRQARHDRRRARRAGRRPPPHPPA
jgi:transposase